MTPSYMVQYRHLGQWYPCIWSYEVGIRYVANLLLERRQSAADHRSSLYGRTYRWNPEMFEDIGAEDAET